MKNLRIIIIGFGLLVVFVIGGIKFLNRHTVITNEQVMARFEKAGGVDKINKEAEVIFRVFGTNDLFILQDYGIPHLNDYHEIKNHTEITNFPAIFALGDMVMVQGGASNAAPEIRVRYGKHNQAKTIHIFPPNFDVDKATNSSNISAFLNDSSYLRVTNNIFAWKGRY